jgi:hypothetical protein
MMALPMGVQGVMGMLTPLGMAVFATLSSKVPFCSSKVAFCVIETLPPAQPFDPDNPPADLPPLPDGYVWGLTITAEAEVIPGPDPAEERT